MYPIDYCIICIMYSFDIIEYLCIYVYEAITNQMVHRTSSINDEICFNKMCLQIGLHFMYMII